MKRMKPAFWTPFLLALVLIPGTMLAAKIFEWSSDAISLTGLSLLVILVLVRLHLLDREYRRRQTVR